MQILQKIKQKRKAKKISKAFKKSFWERKSIKIGEYGDQDYYEEIYIDGLLAKLLITIYTDTYINSCYQYKEIVEDEEPYIFYSQLAFANTHALERLVYCLKDHDDRFDIACGDYISFCYRDIFRFFESTILIQKKVLIKNECKFIIRNRNPGSVIHEI